MIFDWRSENKDNTLTSPRGWADGEAEQISGDDPVQADFWLSPGLGGFCAKSGSCLQHQCAWIDWIYPLPPNVPQGSYLAIGSYPEVRNGTFARVGADILWLCVQQKQQLEETEQLATENLKRAQKFQKVSSDTKWHGQRFRVRDRVWYKNRTRREEENSSTPGVVFGGLWRPCLMLPIALRRRGGSQENIVSGRWPTSIIWNHALRHLKSKRSPPGQPPPRVWKKSLMWKPWEMCGNQLKGPQVTRRRWIGMAGKPCCYRYRAFSSLSGAWREWGIKHVSSTGWCTFSTRVFSSKWWIISWTVSYSIETETWRKRACLAPRLC